MHTLLLYSTSCPYSKKIAHFMQRVDTDIVCASVDNADVHAAAMSAGVSTVPCLAVADDDGETVLYQGKDLADMLVQMTQQMQLKSEHPRVQAEEALERLNMLDTAVSSISGGDTRAAPLRAALDSIMAERSASEAELQEQLKQQERANGIVIGLRR